MTSPIHPLAARGFEAAADAYERGRPTYPAEAVATLVERLDLGPGRTVLELGAGTGKLTRLLVPSGAEILALEPVAGMRARLADATPQARIIDGTAEEIALPGASVDAVVAAQAFHWFDAVRALSEIHRVLRAHGRLALAWNVRDESVPWVGTLGDLLRQHEGTEPHVEDSRWRESLARCALFEPFRTVSFRHVQQLTPAGLVDRVASVSYIAALDPADKADVLASVGELLREDPETAGRDVVDLPYTTELMWAVRRSPVAGSEGVVASVNLNRGGVPKPPVDGTRIVRLGLDGDGHATPEPTHGGVDGAVCLYAQEAIERVRADGHRAFPGAYGENLTLLGIDWSMLAPVDRLAIGDPDAGALLELVTYASPCQTIAPWFTERRIARVSAQVHPEDARWYARVLREGPVAPGMAVRVLTGES